ncbi:hypothetical protein SALBM311S_00728 [Streptomyces alboniger]
MTQEIHGTVADGFEAVREEFAAFVAGEFPDYEGQLCAYVHGRKVVDLWAGEGVTAARCTRCSHRRRGRPTWWPRSWCRTAPSNWTVKSPTTGRSSRRRARAA